MEKKKDSERWREKSRLAKDLKTQGGEFSGFSFCPIFSRLGNEEAGNLEMPQVPKK